MLEELHKDELLWDRTRSSYVEIKEFARNYLIEIISSRSESFSLEHLESNK